MTILVTGAAGFIGFHAARALLARGDTVIGLDNLNDYYDVALKEARLAELRPDKNFRFVKADLKDRDAIERVFAEHKPRRVLHLAAQAGVRYSLTHPHQYIDANIVGFMNVLEGCRQNGVKHLLFASSSSVYGANSKMPYSVHDNVDHPLSLYAATKKANELMAHSYAHLYRLPVTGLRFFTVYGPWGRPDMAPFMFTKKIIAGEPIDVFNQGDHQRDFTYIDDVVEGTIRTLDQVPAADGIGRRTGRIPRPPTRPIASTTSAITRRWRCSISSRRLKRRSASRPRRTCCPCSRAMYTPLMPMSASLKRPPASSRRRRSTTASSASSPGIAITTRFSYSAATAGDAS